MIDVKNRKCGTEGFGKQPSFVVAGMKTVKYCAQHAPDGMVDVISRTCKTKAAARNHRSELEVRKLWSTVHSTHQTG